MLGYIPFSWSSTRKLVHPLSDISSWIHMKTSPQPSTPLTLPHISYRHSWWRHFSSPVHWYVCMSVLIRVRRSSKISLSLVHFSLYVLLTQTTLLSHAWVCERGYLSYRLSRIVLFGSGDISDCLCHSLVMVGSLGCRKCFPHHKLPVCAWTVPKIPSSSPPSPEYLMRWYKEPLHCVCVYTIVCINSMIFSKRQPLPSPKYFFFFRTGCVLIMHKASGSRRWTTLGTQLIY